MNKNDKILPQFGHNDGMTVPDGYFAEFAADLKAKLPDRPELLAPPATATRTWWQRLRPYAYMAAMFAGVWCMLKMITMITSTGIQPLDSNPVIAEAFNNDAFVNEYVISDLNQWDIYDEMMADGLNPDALLDSINFADQINFSTAE